jgi:hypothetical protein
MPFSQTIFKTAFVAATIAPKVLTVTIELAILVLTLIEISIYEFLTSLAMLHKILKTALITTTIFLRIDTKSSSCPKAPLSYV